MPDERPSASTVARKLSQRVKSRGPAEVGTLFVQRARELVASDETLVFFTRPTRGDAPERTDAILRSATAADAARYARDVGTDSPLTFRQRLGDGTRCYVVESEGRIVHATWTTTSRAWVREIQRYFVPPAGDVYIYESYTRPEARGRGIYPFAIGALASELAGQGSIRMWVGVEDDNPASLRAVGKGGFEEAFSIRYTRRLGRLRVSPATGPEAGLAQAILRGPRRDDASTPGFR